MKEVISKITHKIEGIRISGEIDQQIVLLKQMIIPRGETSTPNALYDLQLDYGAVIYYFQGKDFDSFSLNYKTDENIYSGPVFGLKIEKDKKVSLNSLPHVFETKMESKFRSEIGYLPDGGRYTGSGSEILTDEAKFLSGKGVHILKATDPCPFPEQIDPKKAALNILKSMNRQKTNFEFYNQAIQAAEVK